MTQTKNKTSPKFKSLLKRLKMCRSTPVNNKKNTSSSHLRPAPASVSVRIGAENNS